LHSGFSSEDDTRLPVLKAASKSTTKKPKGGGRKSGKPPTAGSSMDMTFGDDEDESGLHFDSSVC
jgi:hypothetical protein